MQGIIIILEEVTESEMMRRSEQAKVLMGSSGHEYYQVEWNCGNLKCTTIRIPMLALELIVVLMRMFMWPNQVTIKGLRAMN